MSVDTEPEVARDAGALNVREAKVALEYHAARAAKRGDDGCNAELLAVRDVIDQLVETIETLGSNGDDLMRKVLAGQQSLTRLPQ
jgi:hypothetical protein